MKKIAVISGFMMLSALQSFAANLSPAIHEIPDATGTCSGLATLENGMTLLLMLSAFYMIGKNFMMEGRMAELRERVKVFFRF